MQFRDSQLLFSPSDLTAYLACPHLTQLARRVALGALERPHVDNPQGDLIKRKGDEHERAYLERLRADGRDVVEISLGPDHDWERAARETVEAMQAGREIVFQGVFVGDGWRGDER